MTLEQQFLSTAGRINRKIFVQYVFAFILLCILLAIPTILLNFTRSGFIVEIISSITFIIIELAMLPGIFLSVKRLHDLNKSALFVIYYILPLINIALLLYLIFFKGSAGDNKYGASPLDDDYDENFSENPLPKSLDMMDILEQKFFSTVGRVNRKPLILYLIFLIVCGIIGFSIYYVFFMVNPAALYMDIVSSGEILLMYYLFTAYIFITMPLRFLLIRRLHDLNLSGWWSILGIILPYGYIVLTIILIFIKGSTKENKYGKSPLVRDN